MAFAHSAQIRETAIKKALTGSDSVRDIAKQMGVGLSTLQRWLREARKSGEPVMAKQEKRPQDWTREERLNALLEAAKLWIRNPGGVQEDFRT